MAFGTEIKGSVFQTTWTWWPEDTLDALDLMLVYLGLSNRVMRPPVMERTRRDNNTIAPMKRALHERAVRSGIALIHPGRRFPNSKAHWYVLPTQDVCGRLKTAGIEMASVTVVDARRWAFAWQQLTAGPQISYWQGENDKLYLSEFPTPLIKPWVKNVSVDITPGRRPRAIQQAKNSTNFDFERNKQTGRRKIVYDPKRNKDLDPNNAESDKTKTGPQL